MSKATTQNIDFSGVRDGGNFNRRRIPAGDYLATIIKVEDAKAKDGIFQYLFSIRIDKHPSSVLPYYCKLQENQLWKLRNLFIAAGITIPKKKVKVDPNRLVNRKIGVTVEDDEYDGKEQSNLAGTFPAAELLDEPVVDDDDEGDDSAEDEDLLEDIGAEEDTDEEEDEIDGMDRAKLRRELRKLDPEIKIRKSQSDDDLRALLREKQSASDDEVTDDELEELDIDDL